MSIELPRHSRLNSKSFIYGVATSAFQIEGATNKDGRIESIWDRFCKMQGNIANNATGDIACEHYQRWQEDIELIASLGVDSYRFSIAWPRVMTQEGQLNQAGVDFYIRILDKLIQLNIKPFVTLYHWDLPQYIEDKGGWLNRETAYSFQHYVDAISNAFGNRVYSYATLNEPFCSAYLGYGTGVHAPGIANPRSAQIAAHHLLLAHGLAMQTLTQNSPDSLNGIVLNFSPSYAKTPSLADQAAAKQASVMLNDWLIEPLMNGQYPAAISELNPKNSEFIVKSDLDIISHPIDFLGVNYYTRSIYKACEKKGYQQVQNPQAQHTSFEWEIFPQGLNDLLVDLNKRYQLPPVFITENGAAFDDHQEQGHIHDEMRVRYFNDHLNALHQAIEQGVDVKGYFAWSLMDNFEWAEVSIGSFLVSFLAEETIANLEEAEAGKYIAYYWGGAMVGRFIGAAMMQRVQAGVLLCCNALASVLLIIGAMTFSGSVAMWSILLVGLCNSIMFPTIFSLALGKLGEQTSQGAGVLCLAIVGGAIIPLFQGILADKIGVQMAFVLPLVCYLYIAYYGLMGSQPK